MRLKTQYAAALAAILVLPWVALFLSLTALGEGSIPGRTVVSYMRVHDWISANVAVVEGETRLDASPSAVPAGIDFSLYDLSGTLIHPMEEPLKPPDGQIVPSLSDAFSLGGKPAGHYVIRFAPGLIERSVVAFRPIAQASLYVLFFAATSAGVAWWLSRTASSVAALKRSLETLAAGHWTVPVPSEGIRVREVREWAGTVERLRKSLVEERAMRGRFLAAVSHDLKTPLTSIGGYLEAIEDGFASDPAVLVSYLAVVRSKAAALSERIDRLLDYGRVETAAWASRLQPGDLTAFLRAAAAELALDAEIARVPFDAEIALGGEITVPLDPAMALRALENVTQNAFRHAGAGGLVAMKATQSGNLVVIEITDNGPGIADDDLPYVFEPFYRGSGQKAGEGSGLGLFAARTISECHGWKLEARSEPGRGATFTFSVPIGPDAGSARPRAGR